MFIWKEQWPVEKMKDNFYLVLKALINLSPLKQFLDGLLRFCQYMELTLQIFKAHSTRSASSSKARLLGISTKEILKRGHWSKVLFL